MSRHHYEASKEIARAKDANDWPYYALIMAAMRLGDTRNQAKLASLFPEVWTELQLRYEAPGGVLPGDPPYLYGPGAHS